MFISKMSLPRRTFLRGLGAAVGLPLLDAMVPAVTALAQTAATPQRRAGFVYVPNGAIMPQWTPAGVGRGFEFSPLLRPLEPFKDRLVVVSNLSRPGSDADHALASSGWLSSVAAKETEGQDFQLGVTIDQVVAQQIGSDTPIRSIEIATEDFAGYVGGCSPGYACAYVNTLSWSSPTTPLPMEINPRAVFERMFGRPGTGAQRLARMRTKRSVLDSVNGDLDRLKPGLGARDRVRLDEYFENIREIERSMERMETRGRSDIELEAPIGIPATFVEHVGLLFDLMAVAYQADLTRVFSFMMAREFSMRTYPEIGVTEPHHPVSHHRNVPAQVAKKAAINLLHIQQFAKFVDKLQTIPDGDGSLLDHSLLFYGAGMGNGDIHSPLNLPLAAIGGPAGRGHRHIMTPDGTRIGSLWLSVANEFGSRMTTFGESTGRVELS
jgi:hypothetical protein